MKFFLSNFLVIQIFSFLVYFPSSSPQSLPTSQSSTSSSSADFPDLIRNYSQISWECKQFQLYQLKKLLFYDARRELNLTVPSSFDMDWAMTFAQQSDSIPYSRRQLGHKNEEDKKKSKHEKKNKTKTPHHQKDEGNDNPDQNSLPYCFHGGDNYLHATYGGLTFNLNNSFVTYGRVYKSNSENIVYSFAKSSLDNLTSYSFIDLNRAIGSSSYANFIRSIPIKYHQPLSQMKIFSFFRHPIHHFLSGLVESHFRSQCQLHNTDFTNKEAKRCVDRFNFTNHVNDNAAIPILLSIFSCESNATKPYLSSITHIAPQSSTLHEWKPHFIGYLENFMNHWKELEVFIDRSVPYLPVYHHITEDDPFHLRYMINRIFKRNTSYLRAVCRLLMSDFICLGFKLPQECEDMIDSQGRYIPFPE